MSDELDFSKPEELQTVSGKNVRIFCTDGCKPYEALGAVEEQEGWSSADWTIIGKFIVGEDSSNDLVRKPRRVNGWVNVYKKGDGSPYFGQDVYSSQDLAKMKCENKAQGQIYIDAEIQT